jgi:hypothetical protein
MRWRRAEARGIGPFATVVKARPTDVHPEVFRILKERLRCIRVYVGIETDADQGLVTLGRWSSSPKNHKAIELVRALDLYTCFNMLLFDPDTTVESLERNIDFMRAAADFPFNFGRVELYAGTPLLDRMLREGRCWGDYMQWDYALASPAVERIFALAMRCFHPRNFGPGALANRMMGTRFDIEVARHFHPDLFDPAWLDEGRALSRALGVDSADGLAAIVAHVRARPEADDGAFAAMLSSSLRAREAELAARAEALAIAIWKTLGRGRPLTQLGDRVATPLQPTRTVEEVHA